MTRQHSLSLSTLPTLCLVKLVAVSSTNLSSLPHLDHLALIALDATTEQTPPTSLREWLERLRGTEPSEALLGAVEDIHTQVVKVRRRGLDAAVSWAHNEMKPLVAWNEEDEVSLHTYPLLRSSPLGMYLRRTYLHLSKMGFDEAVEWWGKVEMWCDGTLGGMSGRAEEDVAERFAQARLRQDYHASRELVRSFATTSADGSSDSSPQEALLHLALVEYEDGGLEAAQQALDEATQIARNRGDVACLSACSSLRKRLFTACPAFAGSSSTPYPDASSSSPAAGPSNSISNPNAPYDLLHSLGSASSSTPLPSLFSPLYSSLALHHRLSFPPIPPSSTAPGQPPQQKKEEEQRPLPPAGTDDGGFGEDWAAGWEAAAGGIWGEMGITPLATLHDSLSLAFLDPSRPSWDISLPLLSRQATRLCRANKPDEALGMLFEAVETREKRRGMGVREVGEWGGLVEMVEGEREGRRSGRYDPTTQDSNLPLPSLLSTSLLTLQTSLLTSAQPIYFLSLLSVIDHRLSLAGPRGKEEGERGLRECEEVWGGVLALSGCGAGGAEEEGEWRVVEARAREVKARCLVVACQGEDTQLPAAVELLEEALSIYSSLSLPPSLLRTLSTLIHLTSHLSTSPSLPPTSSAHWHNKRDEYARRWMEVKRGLEGDEAEGERERGERGEKVREVVRAMERAVEAKVGIGR